MTHKKNEEHRIRITDIGTAGEGIGHLDDGYTLFVQGALPGDLVLAHIIKAQKKYGIAKPAGIIEESADRVVPACPLADKCGGCQISALSYEAQLRYKEHKVRELLVRVGGFPVELIDEIFEGITGYHGETPMHYGTSVNADPEFPSGQVKNRSAASGNNTAAAGTPVRFRNKAQYPVGCDKTGRIITGFYAPHSHRAVPCEDCLIGAVTDGQILSTIREFMDEYHVNAYDELSGEGLIRHILIRTGYMTGEIQICIVINGDEIPHADVLTGRLHDLVFTESESDDLRVSSIQGSDTGKHPCIVSICTSTNIDDTNVILGDNYRVIYGQGHMTDRIDDLEFRISPLSFYQVNPVQTRKLYGKALEYASLTGTETVWDLYCGIGTISLFLARSAGRVYGVEVVPEAIEDACENARINRIDNAEFMVGKAEEVLPELCSSHPDVIVVDPPRKGCDTACLDTMLKTEPDRIVYVSCDPATLARDLKILCGSGEYKLTRVSCTDMFPGSVHVETAVLLQRSDA